MDLLPVDPVLLLVGIAAGLVDAIAGGGGLIVLPALLSTGMPPHIALGTNKLAGTFGTAMATRTYIRHQHLRPRLWSRMAVMTFAASMLGGILVWQVPAPALDRIIPFVILAAALYLLWHRDAAGATTPQTQVAADRRTLLTGLGLGGYDGFFGPGTGAFWMTALHGFFRLDVLSAAGVSRYMNFLSNAAALLVFIALGLVDYHIGLTLGAAIMAGAWLGAHTGIRIGAVWLRRVFLLIVVLIAARLFYLAWLR